MQKVIALSFLIVAVAWAFAPQPVAKWGTKLQALYGYDAGQFKATEGKAAWEIAEEKMAAEKAATKPARTSERGSAKNSMLGWDPNEAAKGAPPNHDYFALDTASKTSGSGTFGWDAKASASSHDERMENMRKPKRAGRHTRPTRRGGSY
mmetsp:Transcript_29346/g.67944  ORF Transcript_29346/g.67944 Transcript_29346/m.67944 type:complete len:150 (+) Transcript_29346:137-586(+)